MDKLSQQIVLKDGRQLGYAEYGKATGQPVFYFHGSASSRLDRPASEVILIEMNIRFIAVDRPGHGLSDYQPHRRLLDWPGDVVQLADHLNLDKFYLVGHSAGGPHTIACAYQHPERVRAAAVVSSVAPMSRPSPYAGMPILNQVLARSARQAPWVTMFIRWLMRRMIMGDVEAATRQMMASIPDSDKAVLYDPKNVEIMAASVREGFRPGHQGVALDDILVNGDWGFELRDVKPRMDIWQGKLDVNVPVQAGEYLADHLPNSRRFILPGKGHFFLISQWGEVLSELVES